ncbi:class I SAM-dependent methyltransferase [Jannaschia formosa]|uniref:class I SAM-dependent methyltransferase n=1 Tax=Jannaschia formosa TaxID=2259592 RepID=UPI000E1BD37A|nr:methyltransferase domain-containing protein [Jannaschia formosa]TFL19703.1 methyltransferase domain-containing protein [Jannaschia formosa]
MAAIDRLLTWKAGRRWSSAPRTRNWWTIPALNDEIERRIANGAGRGVPDLLRAALGGKTAARGVSVAAGDGAKERRLMAAGLVRHFTLYEVAGTRAEAAREAARRDGMADRVEMILGDAFAAPAEPRFDLVTWDHALHHMMDVDDALRWSIEVLRPGGLLLVNDYIGPKRLQFPFSQVRAARAFLRVHAAVLGDVALQVRRRTPVSHLRQILRDPSEAPQSELIPEAWKRRTVLPIRRIGGQLIHLCAPPIAGAVGETHPIYDDLIAADAALADTPDGSHFAVGLWRKPG